MRDGVLLATDVYLPSARGRFPVLLSRMPYDKGGAEFFMPTVARYWRTLGYAVVVQDVRGKARSGGEFDPETLDVSDGYDTIEWIVRQPWSRGQVAMIGDSYAGYTQFAAAAAGHPALAAITPRCASHDRDDQRFDGGVLSLEVSVYWAAETALDEYLYDYAEPFDWTVRPVGQVLTREVGSQRRPRWIDEWATTGAIKIGDPTTKPTPIGRGLPALHLCGLYDHSVAAQFRAWQVASNALPEQYLILDSVDHSWRGLATAGADAAAREDPDSFLRRYNEHPAEFIESVLSGVPFEHDVVLWRPALDTPWREAPSWPPPAAVDMEFRARRPEAGEAWGTLALGVATDAEEAQSWVEWAHDPADPVPSRGYAFHELADRPDLSDLTGRSDTVDFYTAALADPLELAGMATFSGTLAGTPTGTTLVVTLLDRYPDGRTLEVRTGRRRVVGGPQGAAVGVNLGPVAYVFPAGHRLGVRLSSSLFPRLALDSGNGSNTWTEWNPTPTRQRIAIGGHGGARLSCQGMGVKVGRS